MRNELATSQMIRKGIDTSNVTEVALYIVESVIDSAVTMLEEAKNPIKNIKWITHGEFTAERGRNEIERFILTWEYRDRWAHHTEFIQREDWIHSFHYIYCVEWSPATARRPVPRVSASAFFTIKITKNKPPDSPIDVSYIFEGQSLVQRPGMIRFRENWLREIVECKHILLESLPF
ncbi:PREDICTED: A-kinase anchor protein 14 [Condylura cristata]|uniref:A-kinase anchor protein 14 n=1 Tax=Condylura cristata TaxID=143302 RepID=UPI00033441CC|nr:PREDICTED: A-kinase anchor protein 14 [Condylura cristata]